MKTPLDHAGYPYETVVQMIFALSPKLSPKSKVTWILFLCMPVLANSVKTQCEDSKYQFPFKQFYTKLLYINK